MQNNGQVWGREIFIKHVAQKLGRQEALNTVPEQPIRGVPDFYRDLQLTPDEKLDLFMQNWTALTGKVLLVKPEEAPVSIPAYLQSVCREWKVSQASMWDIEPLHAWNFESALAEVGTQLIAWQEREGFSNVGADEKLSPLMQITEQCRIGIVWPEYAIANTGSLVLLSYGKQGRSVSLLPEILFAILRKNQIVTRMGEALSFIQKTYPDAKHLPSSINIITGPSRSADIENDLTIGIHGPGKVYAVIID